MAGMARGGVLVVDVGGGVAALLTIVIGFGLTAVAVTASCVVGTKSRDLLFWRVGRNAGSSSVVVVG